MNAVRPLFLAYVAQFLLEGFLFGIYSLFMHGFGVTDYGGAWGVTAVAARDAMQYAVVRGVVSGFAYFYVGTFLVLARPVDRRRGLRRGLLAHVLLSLGLTGLALFALDGMLMVPVIVSNTLATAAVAWLMLSETLPSPSHLVHVAIRRLHLRERAAMPDFEIWLRRRSTM